MALRTSTEGFISAGFAKVTPDMKIVGVFVIFRFRFPLVEANSA